MKIDLNGQERHFLYDHVEALRVTFADYKRLGVLQDSEVKKLELLTTLSKKLNPVLEYTERRVLMVLQSVGEDYSLNFKGLADNFHRMFGSEIDVATAKKYCRSLRDKGLAVHRNGLFDDSTGLTAGSGYSATDEGMRFNVEEPKAP